MLPEYVKDKVLSVSQAVKVVQDLFFNTSNKLYRLNLPLKHLEMTSTTSAESSGESDLDVFTSFVGEYPDTKFLRIQYLDYTATPRLRVIPIKRALSVLQTQENLTIGITRASLGLLQNDTIIPGVTASGEYRLKAIFSSIQPGPSQYYASLQGEFCDTNGSEEALCPRSILRRSVQEAHRCGLEFLVGFEIEVVFMSRDDSNGDYIENSTSGGHAWNSSRALQANSGMLTVINDNLAKAGIHLEQWHPEAALGQFEFVLPPLPPLEAVGTLLHAREIISASIVGYGLRATLYPKPFPMQCGTASHVHISISSPKGEDKKIYEAFYAGILLHLPAIIAFTYSNPASYDRIADGCWAGGRWVTWGTQNRETPLRKVAGSHWEIKCLDGLANMYLAMAAIISSGTQGVIDMSKLTWGDCEKDPAYLSEDERKAMGIEQGLPKDLNEALKYLEDDTILTENLGQRAVTRYIEVKKAEMKLLEGMNAHDRKQWIIDRY